MTTLYEIGDELRGERIAVKAREIAPPRVEHGSAAHKIQTTVLHRSAYCVIEMPLRAVQVKKQP
ncbi:MAG: hypothetical protein HY671_09285 [Chloroflexi bacterium]|nr:hypothetical protein [Chloroflexota bacterium]